MPDRVPRLDRQPRAGKGPRSSRQGASPRLCGIGLSRAKPAPRCGAPAERGRAHGGARREPARGAVRGGRGGRDPRRAGRRSRARFARSADAGRGAARTDQLQEGQPTPATGSPSIRLARTTCSGRSSAAIEPNVLRPSTTSVRSARGRRARSPRPRIPRQRRTPRSCGRPRPRAIRGRTPRPSTSIRRARAPRRPPPRASPDTVRPLLDHQVARPGSTTTLPLLALQLGASTVTGLRPIDAAVRSRWMPLCPGRRRRPPGSSDSPPSRASRWRGSSRRKGSLVAVVAAPPRLFVRFSR